MELKKAELRYKLTTRDYGLLAAFRHALREFMRFSESAAAEVGLTAQHYQAMLIVRACPESRHVTISDLAHELFIKHNSAVGLVDRLAGERLIVRKPSGADRRSVELLLTAKGRGVLAKLASMHRRELKLAGSALKRALEEISEG